jgi:hypothetical protein
MSDVGRLKRPGGSPFPSVRKSPDPFMPELGQIDFSQDVQEFDKHFSTSVAETEKTEQNIINEETRRKQFRQRQRRKKEEAEPTPKPEKDEDSLIDLTA